jgi:hypothetical protein
MQPAREQQDRQRGQLRPPASGFPASYTALTGDRGEAWVRYRGGYPVRARDPSLPAASLLVR